MGSPILHGNSLFLYKTPDFVRIPRCRRPGLGSWVWAWGLDSMHSIAAECAAEIRPVELTAFFRT